MLGIGQRPWVALSTKIINIEKERIMEMPIAGDKALDFSLPVSREQKVGLGNFLGKKNVVLAFYPLDFTGG